MWSRLSGMHDALAMAVIFRLVFLPTNKISRKNFRVCGRIVQIFFKVFKVCLS